MPMAPEGDGAIELSFSSSVVAELLFLMKTSRRERQQPQLPGVPVLEDELADRVSSFWEGDLPYWELLVLAHEAGALTGPLVASEISSRLGPACDSVEVSQPLRSEPKEDRAVIRSRLATLRSDKRLRRRYLRLVGEVWATYEDDWTRRLLPVITRAVDTCSARASRGETAPWQGLVKSSDTSDKILDAGWARARESRRGLVAICAYGGSLVIDLPGEQFFAMSLSERAIVDRTRTIDLARRLRAIADPTRMALVELVALAPRTIGELAIELGVSQPTVSNHVKILRDSGLIRAAGGAGGGRRLEVDREELQRLFGSVAEVVGGL